MAAGMKPGRCTIEILKGFQMFGFLGWVVASITSWVVLGTLWKNEKKWNEVIFSRLERFETNMDLVWMSMEEAAENFGGEDRVFTACGFSNAFTKKCGVSEPLDGKVVAGILNGRLDVKPFGDGHYRMVNPCQ